MDLHNNAVGRGLALALGTPDEVGVGSELYHEALNMVRPFSKPSRYGTAWYLTSGNYVAQWRPDKLPR
jgi:hypothetical protein